MTRRPSTAEILAAARAADGRKPSGTTSTATAPPSQAGVEDQIDTQEPAAPTTSSDKVDKSDKVVAPKNRRSESERPDAASVEAGAATPPSMASILQRVRAGREGSPAAAIVPPAMSRILEDVRGDRSAPAPLSAKSILDQVRQPGSARPVPKSDSESSEAAKPVSASSQRRMSTAEILAAARKPAGSNASPSSTDTQKTGAAEKRPSARSKTAEILAAARRQDGAGPKKPGAPKAGAGADRPPRPKPPKKTSPPAAESVKGRAATSTVSPPSISEMLSAVRAVAGPQAATATTYPPLSEMIAMLRQQDRRSTARDHTELAGRRKNGSGNWLSRLQRWAGNALGTH